MKLKSILPGSYLLLSLCLSMHVLAQVNQTDSLALVDLYNNTNGLHWRDNGNWLTSNPVSTWSYITVQNQRVIQINLAHNFLSGSLPESIGNLDALVDLYLNDNKLTGNIPSSIVNLVNLTELNLSQCSFSGSLPASLGSMTNLQKLDLYFNQLSGNIPVSLGNLHHLLHVDISSNQFSGSIPSSVGNLSNLSYFNVNANMLSGTIPAAFGKCANLNSLDLGNNQLTGSLPASFQKLNALSYFNVGTNKLSGHFVNIFSDSSQLSYLGIDRNNFDGPIPADFSRLKQLNTLMLAFNNFSGHIPADLTLCTSLQSIDLSFNQLTGKLLPAFADMKNLYNLNLQHNHFTGNIPVKYAKGYYSYLDLSLNELSGDISKFLANSGTFYGALFISNNQLYCSTNPQWTKKRLPYQSADVFDNQFNFNGIEYFAEKYESIQADTQAVLPVHINNNTLSVTAGGTLSSLTFHWFKVGSSQSKTVSGDSTFQPPSDGMYYVRVNDSKVHNSAPPVTLISDTITYTRSAVASTPVAANELKIFISPNPVRDRIQITGLNDKANAKITLADMSGYVWMSTMTRNQTMLQLDVSRLKPGNYLINVNDEKGAVKTIQFVKE